MMRFYQLNLIPCKTAHDLLSQEVGENNTDVVIISEPYRLTSTNKWAEDSNAIGDFSRAIVDIATDVRFHAPCIVAGDFNCTRHRAPESRDWADVWLSNRPYLPSSPCSAQYVKNVNAEAYIEESPKAVKAITEHHYVDDYVDSFDTIDEAHSVIDKVINIHKVGNFELCGFVSNSIELLNKLNVSPKTMELPTQLNHSEPNTEKILGLHWDHCTDEFCFILKFKGVPNNVVEAKSAPTKRQVNPNKVHLWSDSKTDINWIHSDSRRCKQYVAHRVSEILESTNVAEWKWIPGTKNPADVAMRMSSKSTNQATTDADVLEEVDPGVSTNSNSTDKVVQTSRSNQNRRSRYHTRRKREPGSMEEGQDHQRPNCTGWTSTHSISKNRNRSPTKTSIQIGRTRR
ncbi:hypothetical protein ACLKA7_001290, partial [Drosophila subpalustris]